jgi:heme/copper-type cytochrome/quinol oxidase subunit 2
MRERDQRRCGMKRGFLLVSLILTAFLVTSSLAPSLGAEARQEEDGGGSVRLVVTIAVIWLAIMGLVITVVIVTRRKAGEEERESREG